jgi:hypothetical protein
LKGGYLQEGLHLERLARVVLFIADMALYSSINVAYSKYFNFNPPVRVCVALGRDKLPPGEAFLTVRYHIFPDFMFTSSQIKRLYSLPVLIFSPLEYEYRYSIPVMKSCDRL